MTISKIKCDKCGKESKKFYGYPDSEQYCYKCKKKEVLELSKNTVESIDKEISRILSEQKTIHKIYNKIDTIPIEEIERFMSYVLYHNFLNKLKTMRITDENKLIPTIDNISNTNIE